MDTLEKAELTTSIRRITIFLKSGIPIYNSRIQLAKKREGKEEEHRQLQRVMRFTQT